MTPEQISRLLELRRRIVESGVRLLSWEEIDAQVAELRGKHTGNTGTKP